MAARERVRRWAIWSGALVLLVVGLTYVVDLFPEEQKEIRSGIRKAAEEAFPEDAAEVAAGYGFTLLRQDSSGEDDPGVLSVALIHGLDDPGKVWRNLEPVLQEQGLKVWRFRYPNDQSIVASSSFLFQELEGLRQSGVEEIVLVAHSMGGLVSREMLTSPELGYPEAARSGTCPRVLGLVLVATPSHGSELARFGVFGELRDQWVRMLEGRAGLLGSILDGVGEARLDLLPGSSFLVELNARLHPDGVKMLIIAGDMSPWTGEELNEVTAEGTGNQVEIDQMKNLGKGLGDGLVSIKSTRLDGIPHAIVHGTHLSMIRNVLEDSHRLPPAIPLVVEFLQEVQEVEHHEQGDG